MTAPPSRKIETLLAQAGTHADASTGALVPPLHLATTFERDPDGGYPRGFYYSRAGNPTRNLLEQTMAQLEGGAEAFAFSSGMAAANALLQTLKPGDEIIIGDDIYHGVRKLVRTHYEPRGVAVHEVDTTDPANVEDAINDRVRLVWIETPSNPMLKITEIAAVARMAHGNGCRLVVDGTWTTPVLQRPLDLGADFLMHAATKYLGGHSDALLGLVVSRVTDEVSAQLREMQTISGAVADPFTSWLVMRGMRTLSVRLRTQCATAESISRFLAGHPAVEAVFYPGLENHPGHAAARTQMSGFGGMLSFTVAGGEAEAMRVAAAVQVFRRATSLGGTESLIEHRASIEARPTRTPVNLLRISAGLEHPDDLVNDLRGALDSL